MTTQNADQINDGQNIDDQNDELEHDQDSEPTMTAPEEGRPDGLSALKDEGDEVDDADEAP